MSTFIITRIQVGDYEAWRPMFDQDRPKAREKAVVQRVFRNLDDPNHVFIFLEFASAEDAQEARQRLVESGVLDRFRTNMGLTSSKRWTQPAPCVALTGVDLGRARSSSIGKADPTTRRSRR